MRMNWRRTILPALLLLALAGAQPWRKFGISISVNVPPPELPVYDQPPIPGDGYMWTPGYWAWGDDIQDYYWVPGTWVLAPQPGFLWTPGYWGSDGRAYSFGMRAIGAPRSASTAASTTATAMAAAVTKAAIGKAAICLQSLGDQCQQYDHHQRLQQDRHQQCDGESGELQRRQRRRAGAADRRRNGRRA